MATQAELAVLRGTATQVKNESQVGGNTAGRVGGLFEGIVDALPSDEVIDGKITQAVADIQPIVIEGDVDNAPDQEDLTSVNQGGTDVLKFKDKTYSPALFSGLGRVYLRKNVVTPENLGYAINLLTAEMVSQPNIIYHIQYDYDLNGQTITLPAKVTLQFDGGSLANGTIVGNHTKVLSENVCFKKSLEFSGSWDGVIYSRWFEFVSANDEYISTGGVETRNPNPTDNILCFKQIQAIVNGTGAGKVEFEKDQYLQAKIQGGQTVTNRYITDDCVIMWFKNAYIDINLNGTTIKSLYSVSTKNVIILSVNCDGKIYNGKLIGFANKFDYPNYVDYDGNTKNNYEWCAGLNQAGGKLEIADLFVSNFAGDCLMVGSGTDPGAGHEVYIGNYNIHDCELSYCGRNALSLHSSKMGVIRNVSIHNIGSDGGGGVIGSDGIMGRSPMSGIDIEYEDAGNVQDGNLTFEHVNIKDCYAYCIIVANNTAVTSATFNDMTISGILNTANLIGEQEFRNSHVTIDNGRGSLIFLKQKWFDSTIEIKRHMSFYGSYFKNCTIDENEEGTSIAFSSEWQTSASYSAIFDDCVITLNHSAYIDGFTFNGCTINLNGTSYYASMAKFIDCEINGGALNGSGYNCAFAFSGNSNYSSFYIEATNSRFRNLRGLNQNNPAFELYTNAKNSVRLFECVIEYCNGRVQKGQILFDGCKFVNDSAGNMCSFTIYGGAGDALTHLQLKNCIGDVGLAGYTQGVISISQSALNVKYYNYTNFSMNVDNSALNDITPNNINPTIGGVVRSSSLIFKNAYQVGTLHLINSFISGVSEASFAGIKENAVFAVPLPTSGTTAQRPSASVAGVGFKYFDTDLNSPVYSDGTNWVLSANGGEDEVDHGTSDTTFALTPNVLHKWGEVAALTLTLASGTSGKINEYMFQFTSGATPTVLTVPNTVNWVSAPNIEASTTYQASIVNNIGVIVGV